jgi:hypothetical protein
MRLIYHVQRLRITVIVAVAWTGVCLAEGSVSFVTPSDGQVVRPGEAIAVVLAVNPSLGATQGGLMMIWNDKFGAMELAGPPFETTIEMPVDASGPVLLSALIGTPGAQGMAEIELQVVPDESPIALSTGGDAVLLSYPDDPLGPQRIAVSGLYADGSRRNVRFPNMGTTYVTADPGVAVVDENGIVTAVGPGRTLITVRNGSAVTWVAVDVMEGTRLNFAPVEQTQRVAIQRSGFRAITNARQYVQTVRVTNNSSEPILTPLHLMLEGLPNGVRLPRGGKTKSISPVGEWSVSLRVEGARFLGPGEAVSAEITFYNPDGVSINYNPRLYTAIEP